MMFILFYVTCSYAEFVLTIGCLDGANRAIMNMVFSVSFAFVVGGDFFARGNCRIDLCIS